MTTVEIKSGYGLDTANEMKQLRAARRLAADLPVTVRTTLLAAHALPPEFAGRADDYIDYVCRDTIPAAAAAGLADAVDAFCETIGFTPAQVRRVFDAARAHGLPREAARRPAVGSRRRGARGRGGRLSADHLEYTNAVGVTAMALAGTVAVLLPGAYYALRETQLPPVDGAARAGVPIAIATDCNPGTSPVTSPLLMLNMACTLFRLTPEEALAGLTVHGARALGLADRGMLAPGMRADLACWDVAEPAELAYRIGGTPAAGIVQAGRIVHWTS